MSEIQPDYDSVFTPEYWGDLDEVPPNPPMRRIDRGVYRQMDELTAHAAQGIFLGDPRTPLAEGGTISADGENYQTVPGNVLLVDIEAFGITTRIPRESVLHRDQRRPFHKQNFIQREDHLMALPSTLFRLNSKQIGSSNPLHIVYPYTKGIVQPELQAYYARMVRLLTYAVDNDGDPTARMLTSWRNKNGNRVMGGGSVREAFRSTLPALKVGRSYISPEANHVVRVKSAEICLYGTIEYAKARKKVRRGVLAGRLALSKKPA